MKQIRDNGVVLKEELHEIPGLVKAIANKTLDELAKEEVFVFPEVVRESEDLSYDQMILQSVNDMYCTGNVMGFVGYGNERLAISSRFSKDEDDFFFQYLLERVLEFPNTVNLETDAVHNDRMFSLLLFLFPRYLAAAMRKGPFKTYVKNEYNDANVKGTIDVARHIRKNVPFVGNVAYNQREYSFNNYLMQLIRHTIEYIKRKPYGDKLLVKVKDEVNQVIEATPDYEAKNLRKVLIENKKNTVRHAFFNEYKALQRLCILILQDEKVQVGIGNRKLYGILFDGAWLWEEYVNTIINKPDKELFYHPMNKDRKGIQFLFTKDGKRKGTIYPDFIGKSFTNRIIADAKYKPVDNIGNKDYLQVLAYMYRFDSKKAFYFYPDAENAEDEEFWLNKGSSYENNVEAREDICLIKHGLHIPSQVESYDEFLEEIKKSECLFAQSLKDRMELKLI